jgi:ABC-type nickel/cobalt efflux system permease component RcnA
MVLPIGTGVILALVFSLLLESWVMGAVVGAFFAIGFAAVLVITARGAAKKKRKTTRLR